MEDRPRGNNGVHEDQPARRGFTLMEVVLVLVLMALIAGAAWPSVQRLYASRRLGSAADQIRSAWCQARIEAMRSGHTYTFRYQLDGDHYRLEAQSDQGVASSASAGAAGGDVASGAATCAEQTLPEGIKFSSAASGGDTAAQSAGGQSDGWSAPILFYPDGTALDVQLVLADQRSRAVRVILRGMTGAVTLSDLDTTVE